MGAGLRLSSPGGERRMTSRRPARDSAGDPLATGLRSSGQRCRSRSAARPGPLQTPVLSAVGGSFPIFVEGVGCIGAVTVSGLRQRDDHEFVVEALAVRCGVEVADIRLD